MDQSLTFVSPLGPITVTIRAGAITRLRWDWQGDVPPEPQPAPDPLLLRARDRIAAYFTGDLSATDLPLQVEGSDFQRAVCAAMLAIPAGETRTYGEIARGLGVPAQAVGQACGGNPIPLLIPCHRVLGSNGLGGFSGAGGIESKVWLLRHEGAAGLLI